MKTFLVGLTGGFGTGKSTVLKMFRKCGAHTISADEIVKDCWRPGNPVYSRLKALVQKQGLLKSPKDPLSLPVVAREAFQNKTFRTKLEKILHPEVFRKINLARKRETGILVAEIPLLFETGFNREANFVVTVKTSSNKSKARLKEFRGLSSKEWETRSKVQWSMDRKMKKSDAIIRNNGNLTQTQGQVKKIWNQINCLMKVNKGEN